MSIIINEIRAISGRKISPQRRMLQREVSNLLNQDINDIVELTKNLLKNNYPSYKHWLIILTDLIFIEIPQKKIIQNL